MARRLTPVTFIPVKQSHSHLSLQIDSHQFRSGFVHGLTNQETRLDISSYPTEAGIVAIVRNLCEMAADKELTDALLRHDCGLIAGWLTRHEVSVVGEPSCDIMPE